MLRKAAAHVVDGNGPAAPLAAMWELLLRKVVSQSRPPSAQLHCLPINPCLSSPAQTYIEGKGSKVLFCVYTALGSQGIVTRIPSVPAGPRVAPLGAWRAVSCFSVEATPRSGATVRRDSQVFALLAPRAPEHMQCFVVQVLSWGLGSKRPGRASQRPCPRSNFLQGATPPMRMTPPLPLAASASIINAAASFHKQLTQSWLDCSLVLALVRCARLEHAPLPVPCVGGSLHAPRPPSSSTLPALPAGSKRPMPHHRCQRLFLTTPPSVPPADVTRTPPAPSQ